MPKPIALLLMVGVAVLGSIGAWWLVSDDSPTPTAFGSERDTVDAVIPDVPADMVGAGDGSNPEANVNPIVQADSDVEGDSRASASDQKLHEWIGVVEDANGEPVSSFTLEVRPSGVVGGEAPHSKVFDGTNGLFWIADLEEGSSYDYTARGNDHPEPATGVIVIHDDMPRTVIRLGLATRVRGVVLDPNGSPVANATVLFRWRLDDKTGVHRDVTRKSDARGAFECSGIGIVEITADFDGFAKSERIDVEVPGPEDVVGVEIRLRAPGGLTGIVLDKEGRARPGSVSMQGITDEAFIVHEIQTERDGTFAFHDLPAGAYLVMAQPEDHETRDSIQEFESLEMATCDIVAGEITHVVLGGSSATQVRLFGQVTLAGEPIPEAGVMIVAEGPDIMASWEMTRCDAEGRYELILEGPGDHVILLSLEGMSDTDTEFFVDIPDVREYRLDLASPANAVSGRLLGAAEAVADMPQEEGAKPNRLRGKVTLEPLGASFVGLSGGRETKLNRDGTYAFERIAPGRYQVRAFAKGLAPWEIPIIGPEIVVAAGADLRNVDLNFEFFGTLKGKVLDEAGQPVAGAEVFCQDPEGRHTEHLAFRKSTSDGSFLFKPIPPGSWTVLARHEGRVSAPVGPIGVASWASESVEIRLGATGTHLALELEGSNVAGTHVRVLDAGGHDWSRVMTEKDLEAMILTGFSTRCFRYGPLPAGTYEVVATTSSGTSKKRTVEVGSKPETLLQIQL